MDKQVILHKLQKYQTKLRNNPSNYVYQQKVTQYEHMIGGGGTPWRTNNMVEYTYRDVFGDRKFLYSKTTYQITVDIPSTGGKYSQLILKNNDVLKAYNENYYKLLRIELDTQNNITLILYGKDINNNYNIIKCNALDESVPYSLLRILTTDNKSTDKSPYSLFTINKNPDYTTVKNYITNVQQKIREISESGQYKLPTRERIDTRLGLEDRKASLVKAATPQILPVRNQLSTNDLFSGK
jgi:hypothetical protein